MPAVMPYYKVAAYDPGAVLVERMDLTGPRAKPLDETTWTDFARPVEKHDCVWGGCWCMAFHARELSGRWSPRTRWPDPASAGGAWPASSHPA